MLLMHVLVTCVISVDVLVTFCHCSTFTYVITCPIYNYNIILMHNNTVIIYL